MAKNKDPKKAKKTPTDSSTMWQNFLTDIDKDLNEINKEMVKIQGQDSDDMKNFTQDEATLTSVAAEFGGAPPFPKKPDWKEILSTDFTTSHKGVHFGTIIYDVLSEKTVEEDEKAIREINILQTIHDAFQKNYTTSRPSNLEEFADWIGTSILDLEKDLDVATQGKVLVELNDLIFKAGESALQQAPWTEFDSGGDTNLSLHGMGTTGFNPCHGSNNTGIWPERFCSPIWNILMGNAGEEQKIMDKTLKILKTLSATLTKYNPNDEASVRNWIQDTITGLQSNIVSNFQKEELIANLEFAVIKIFPQPDESFFYSNFQELLYQNIYSPPKMDQTTQKLLDDIKRQQELIDQHEDLLKDDELKLGTADHHLSTGETGFETGGTGEPTPPSFNPFQHQGVKQVLEQFFKHHELFISNKDKKKLEKDIINVIKIGITDTFSYLVDQGTQGELMTATYDRQIISRIVDYTTNLLNNLNTDLDQDIPKNGSNSLTAAQDVTAAAVAFRQYSDTLLAMKVAFDGERNRQVKDSTTGGGYNYQKVSKLIDGPNSDDPNLATVKDLANAVYLGTGAPQPLVKQAEYYGVQLAAITAGLQTSLQKLLINDQSAAISALANLKQNAEALFDEKYKAYQTDASTYFTDLDNYISSRQQYKFDQMNRDIVYNSLQQLTGLIERGEVYYEADSIS